MKRLAFLLFLFITASLSGQTVPGKGNRLAYLDESDPYYPHRDFPKLTTPQWVGEDGVDAVVVLAIDDMKDHKKYETFLRPILDRLQNIDGRAPVSIMTCSIDPKEPHLQKWLKEGLSLECHTFDHPCPFFKSGFDKAKTTYEKCVDLLHEVPGNKPVAFRMPCCDSLNTPSPRFFAEIFNRVSEKKNFLQIDSSVFNVFTSADKELPRELVLDDKGLERFKRYLPVDRSFVNTIENYPYPYVIGKLCWQFPCVTPSDWQAQHLQKPNSPRTLEDWKAALDCTVIKKGVFCLVFHPHGWIKSEQVVELIDHAEKKHGKKVKFLNFREAQERLDKNLLKGRNQRTQGVYLLVDLNQDGYLDMFARGENFARQHWLWTPAKTAGNWKLVEKKESEVPDNFVKLPPLQGNIVHVVMAEELWLLLETGTDWHIYAHTKETLTKEAPTRLPFSLPPGARPFAENQKDTGLRFIDLDGDGKLDLLFSNEKEYGIYLFEDMKKGWSKKIMAGKAGDKNALPMIARSGTSNGFWVHSGYLWWSNEDTAALRDHVDRRSIKKLLGR